MSTHMTLGEMAKALNRPAIILTSLQKRFELPVLEGATYSPAYFAFLRKIVHLKLLGISEKDLIELWKTEKHLLQLLHFDATGSPTWYLDECVHTRHPERRLLLTHHDLGPEFLKKTLQPQLDFTPKSRGLFSQREMGDDARRALDSYLARYANIQSQATAEAAQLRNALHWFPRICPPRKHPATPLP
ncbi:MAG: hypothetical protein RBS84_00790 [Kiritimatiellia bacterium]|nr:hypothetical protein [Kiritimatiellia bacterium]